MLPRISVVLASACVLLSASCGPSRSTCLDCFDLFVHIGSDAHDKGISVVGVCGDAETGEGTQPGFEKNCEEFRSSCLFVPNECEGAARDWATLVTGTIP